jgi:menaquinone-9 beta-reductase
MQSEFAISESTMETAVVPPAQVECRAQAADDADTAAKFDVAVIGGGLSGLAACIFLRQAGFSVVCIEPELFPHGRVGESLDWSTPRLLEALGVPGSTLLEAEVGVPKLNIKVVPMGGKPWTAAPLGWFQKWPLKWEIRTFHVDRAEMDQRLFERAAALGTVFIWERVATVEADGERVAACRTAGGRCITAPWFLDSSGQARVVARKFGIEKKTYGQPKVCFWTYFSSPPRSEGTTFYGNTVGDDYLAWIWEIPISPRQLSIGCVMPAASVKEQRQKGMSPQDMLWEQLAKYPPLAALAADHEEREILRCSYQSYVSRSVTGPNWLMMGEAASVPDPLTGNGVTAAFRHAEEACEMIQAARGRDSFSRWRRRAYDLRVRGMGNGFNHAIERTLYEAPVRHGLGTMAAQTIYTAFGYPINAIYTRMRPQRKFRTRLLQFVLNGFWFLMEGSALAGRLAFRARGRPAPVAGLPGEQQA